MEITDPTSGRLMRWRLRRAEYDFDVEYRKGSLHVQPDALSRLASDGHATEHEYLEIPCLVLDLASLMNSPTLAKLLALQPSIDSDDEIETDIRPECSKPLQPIQYRSCYSHRHGSILPTTGR
eukprot:IDg14639t1